jgi:hypothetical protein
MSVKPASFLWSSHPEPSSGEGRIWSESLEQEREYIELPKMEAKKKCVLIMNL